MSCIVNQSSINCTRWYSDKVGASAPFCCPPLWDQQRCHDSCFLYFLRKKRALKTRKYHVTLSWLINTENEVDNIWFGNVVNSSSRHSPHLTNREQNTRKSKSYRLSRYCCLLLVRRFSVLNETKFCFSLLSVILRAIFKARVNIANGRVLIKRVCVLTDCCCPLELLRISHFSKHSRPSIPLGKVRKR